MLQTELTPEDYAIVRHVTRLKTLMELSIDTGIEINALVLPTLELVLNGVLLCNSQFKNYPSFRMSDRGRQLLHRYEEKIGRTAA